MAAPRARCCACFGRRRRHDDVDVRILDPRLHDHLPGYATRAPRVATRACVEDPLVLAPGVTHLVNTGLAIHIADPGYAALILPRWVSAIATASC